MDKYIITIGAEYLERLEQISREKGVAKSTVVEMILAEKLKVRPAGSGGSSSSDNLQVQELTRGQTILTENDSEELSQDDIDFKESLGEIEQLRRFENEMNDIRGGMFR